MTITRDKQRDWRPDLLKAAAILAVVAIHTGVQNDAPLRFCVPVFIGIWAYYLERSLAGGEDMPAVLLQRGKVIVAAYAFWTAIYLVCFRTLGAWQTTPVTTIVNGWLGGYGWAGQYFFIVLLQLTVLTPWLRGGRSLAIFATAVSLLLLASAPYLASRFRLFEILGSRPFFYWLPFYYAGVAFAHKKPSPILSFTGLSIAALLLLVAGPERNFIDAAGGSSMPYFTLSVLGTSVGLLTWAFGDHPPVSNEPPQEHSRRLWSIVSTIGGATFAIYTGHLLVLLLLDIVVPAATRQMMPAGLWWALRYVFATGGSLAVGRLLQVAGMGIVVGRQ